MPRSGLKLCAHGSCMLATSGKYCEAHKGQATRYPKGTRQERGYGKAWQYLRKVILIRDSGWCQPCLKIGRLSLATEVDHITPKALGGEDEYDNLQAICKQCHMRKTAQEGGGARGKNENDVID